MASRKVLDAVKAGKQALAKFRATNPNVLLDLTEADLKGADLRGMNLRRSVVGRNEAGSCGFERRES